MRRVHLRVALSDDAHRAAVLVEDALRTASFPIAERGRMLFIRRLDLGRIPRNAGPRTVALQIERAVRELAPNAVHFDSLSADEANAVLIPDRVEALTRLARLQADGAPSPHWFWSRLVPGWRSDFADEGNWLRLLEAAHALPEAPVAAAAIVDQMVAAGGAEELLGLSRDRAREWMGAAGFDAGGSDASPNNPQIEVRLSRRIEAVAAGLLESRPVDDRLVWLVTLLAVHDQPSRAGNPRLPRSVRRWLEARRSARSERETRPGGRATRVSRTARDLPPAAPISEVRSDAPPAAGDCAPASRAEREASPSTDLDRDRLGARVERGEADRGVAAARPAEHLRHTRGTFTDCAGLLFLVPVLERLTIGPWLREHPSWLEGGFPARLLQTIGERTGVKHDDPIWLALEEIAGALVGASGHRGTTGFRVASGFSRKTRRPAEAGRHVRKDAWLPAAAGSYWPEAVRTLLAAPPPRCALGSLLDVWLTAVRRWCRRHARMGLTTLVRRGGHVRVSRSRIDICFDLSQLDLRVRRMALDVDPGWVPWLGRVVCFHYLDADEQR